MSRLQAITDLPLRAVAVVVLVHISFAGMRLALMLAALHLGASAWEVGILVSLLMVVPVFIAMPVGRWADRVGHLPPAWTGMALVGAGALVAGLFPHLTGFGVAAVLAGSGQSVLQLAMMNAVGHAPGPRGSMAAFAALGLGFSVSGFVGPVTAGLLIDLLGHVPTFFCLCLPPLLAARLVGRTAGRPAAQAPALPSAATGATAVAGSTAGSATLWRHPGLRAALIITALLSMAWDLFTFIMPLHASGVGLSATAIGTVSGCMAAGTFVIRLVLGAIARRVQEGRLLITVLGLTVLCLLAFPFANSFASLAALAFVLGLVLGSGQPTALSLLHRAAPPHRTGEAMGVRTLIVSLSQTVLPIVFGSAGAALGTGAVFWVSAVLIGAATAAVRRRM